MASNGAAPDPAISVVIPTKDRPALLERCVAGVLAACDATGRRCELLVVDDGSAPPVAAVRDERVRVLRTTGVGPSRARNLGIAGATAPVVAFTDDDVEVDVRWLAEALETLESFPAAAGVTGRTDSPTFDPLYEHSVFDHDGGSYLTCNVAYRASALRAVGGFDRQFPHAAHEDRDLAWRVRSSVGDVRFNPAMRVVHPGRPFGARQWDRRGRLVVDDWLLLRRFPDAKASRLPVRVAPLASMLRRWRTIASAEGGIDGSPRRAARWARLAAGQLAVAGWVTATQWRHHKDRSTAPAPGLERPALRIAYVGPVPNPRTGGAPGVAGLLLEALAARGSSIDCYVATSRETEGPGELGGVPGIEVVAAHSRFGFERWYSRDRLTKMASHQVAAALARRRLAATLAARHRAVPYDVIYQCSNLESFGVPGARQGRPPLVVHPSVHAAGELRWMREERVLSAALEGAWRPMLVRAWLVARAARQRRDARRADRVLAISPAFRRDLVSDYGLDPDRVAVVPNCIDLERFGPATPIVDGGVTAPASVVSVGRLTVRKGLEDVVALSHALRDLAGHVEVLVVGAPSLWSDYSGMLEDLDDLVGRAVGHLDRDEVARLLARSLCLVQLSRYEPFGLTVAEALACGTPVIVTPAVGAAQGLPADVARVVEPGDVTAAAAAVRELLALSDDERAYLAARCRKEAARFAPGVVAALLEAELVAAAQSKVS
ncbi:MAG TPA: glycosyltransferase [Acidimicrobiales bacterium]|nr:glycosyltransferase [Acidimicrobiales bacterium]